MQEADSHEQLLDLAERAEAIEGIRRGLDSGARGEGRPAEEISAEPGKRLEARRPLTSDELT